MLKITKASEMSGFCAEKESIANGDSRVNDLYMDFIFKFEDKIKEYKSKYIQNIKNGNSIDKPYSINKTIIINKPDNDKIGSINILLWKKVINQIKPMILESGYYLEVSEYGNVSISWD